jgi:hypothetical protein
MGSGYSLGEVKEVNAQQFLRGNGHEYDYDDLIRLEGEEFGVELSNVTADERDGRHLVQMSNRDMQWLNSHNIRRKKYHSKYNKKYVPLRWSPKLKRSSKQWAKHLANICGSRGESTK